MHADQFDVTPEVVADLVAEQHPQWRGLDPVPVQSGGTVNALFRLGEEVVVRLPLRPDASAAARGRLEREQELARSFASGLAVSVPEPRGIGAPGAGYDGWWSVYRWIPGEVATPADGASIELAADIAAAVRAIRALPTGGAAWDGRSRGGPLALRHEPVRAALARSGGLVDVEAVGALWARCLGLARWEEPAVWIHADLMPGNLLVRDGRLVGVIDFESACVGDPAVDLMPAWNLLDAPARRVFRDALGVDEATWERGRGWAIVQAIVALPYYVESNPAMAQTARRTLAAVLE